MAKRQRVRWGDVLAIKLANEDYSFAHIIVSPYLVFYDFKSAEIPSLSDITSKPLAFVIAVHQQDVRSGRWPKIGNVAVADENATEPVRFGQDLISGRLSLRHSSFENYEKPALLSECQGLDCDAVSDTNHVEDRLEDHYNQRPNKWVQMDEIDVSKVPADQLK